MNKSAARAIDVLEVLSKSKKAMTLTEIGRVLGLPKSSCFDIVYTLVERGALEIDSEELKTFKLGIKTFQIGYSVLKQTELYPTAHPLLTRLSEETGETVYLAVENNGEIVYLDKVESNEPIRSTLTIGSRSIMYYTGLGKALLASFPQEKVKQIVGEGELITRTAKSLKNCGELLKDLEITRVRGYAIDDLEAIDFVRCVAAPVRDHKGEAVAAISVAALDIRLPMEKVPEISKKVTATALEISRRLGFTGDKLYED